MRQLPLRIVLRSLLSFAAIAIILGILWVWATRPPHLYSDWLGLVGFPDDAPQVRLLTWISEERAPRTPLGCLSVFEAQEVCFAGILLLALLLLTLPLIATFGENWLGRRLKSPVRIPRSVSMRCRVATMLVTIAIVAIYLGWEIHAWRSWRVRRVYLDMAANSAVRERETLAQMQSMREELARLESNPLPSGDLSLPETGFYRSTAALAAERAVVIDQRKRELNYLSALADAHAARKRKYEQTGASPPASVEDDLASRRAEPDAWFWVAQRDYARALAAYDALAQAYPDYAEAYQIRGWIRATCPDARFRDGRIAVELATRACDLTGWKDAEALATLAAAFAETGSYPEAVKWQRRVLSLTISTSSAGDARERLELYKAGKTYRQK
jgi:tetratricopeptide (TPR) repeat protein